MEVIIMSVEYKFELPDDYFLLRVDKLVEECLYNHNTLLRNIEILKINRNSLSKISRSGRETFAKNLVSKIDYLLEKEEDK